jgi:hypothetical protein
MFGHFRATQDHEHELLTITRVQEIDIDQMVRSFQKASYIIQSSLDSYVLVRIRSMGNTDC